MIASMNQAPTSPAMAAINRALDVIPQARRENAATGALTDEAKRLLDGFAPHVKNVKLDGPGKDVSDEGHLLRQMAQRADLKAGEGLVSHARTSAATAAIAAEIDAAIAVVPAGSSARYYLETARNEATRMTEWEIRDLTLSVRNGRDSLTNDVDPWLTEVEHDDATRDVGRFAADLHSCFANGRAAMATGSLVTEWIDRDFDTLSEYLVAARNALPR